MNQLVDRLIFIPFVAFAVFRVVELIVVDNGPFSMFVRFRSYLGKEANDKDLFYELAELFTCPFCMGVWVSFFFTLFLLPLDFSEFLICWLSITGMQSFLQSMVAKRGE